MYNGLKQTCHVMDGITSTLCGLRHEKTCLRVSDYNRHRLSSSPTFLSFLLFLKNSYYYFFVVKCKIDDWSQEKPRSHKITAFTLEFWEPRRPPAQIKFLCYVHHDTDNSFLLCLLFIPAFPENDLLHCCESIYAPLSRNFV